jgi:hypothetical protein
MVLEQCYRIGRRLASGQSSCAYIDGAPACQTGQLSLVLCGIDFVDPACAAGRQEDGATAAYESVVTDVFAEVG